MKNVKPWWANVGAQKAWYDGALISCWWCEYTQLPCAGVILDEGWYYVWPPVSYNEHKGVELQGVAVAKYASLADAKRAVEELYMHRNIAPDDPLRTAAVLGSAGLEGGLL